MNTTVRGSQLYWSLVEHIDYLCVEIAEVDDSPAELRQAVREWLEDEIRLGEDRLVLRVSREEAEPIYRCVLDELDAAAGAQPNLQPGDWIAIDHQIIQADGRLLLGKVLRPMPILPGHHGCIVKPHSLPETRNGDRSFAFIARDFIACHLRSKEFIRLHRFLTSSHEPTRELAMRAVVELPE